jgi:hypothetical protein
MPIRQLFVAAVLCLCAASGSAEPQAKLIHFTEDGTRDGVPLSPGFDHHSVWSGIGMTEEGQVYVAASNHSENTGNVVIYALEAEEDRLRRIDDLKSVSQRAGNWLDDETQYKVHSLMLQHADGLVYFSTMAATDPSDKRGAHLYALDPETEEIRDLSATMPFLVDRSGAVVENTGRAEMDSGVITARASLKGIGLNPAVPDLLYGVTHDTNLLLKIDLASGEIETIGPSAYNAFLLHVDAEGDAYYAAPGEGDRHAIVLYDLQSGTTSTLMDGFSSTNIGGIVARPQDDLVALLAAKEKRVFLMDTAKERVFPRPASVCGSNRWELYNMTGSPDGEWLYFVSNNNSSAQLLRMRFSGATCQKVLDLQPVIGNRDLAFGGENIWLGDSFYVPVWTHQREPSDLALLKITID